MSEEEWAIMAGSTREGCGLVTVRGPAFKENSAGPRHMAFMRAYERHPFAPRLAQLLRFMAGAFEPGAGDRGARKSTDQDHAARGASHRSSNV